jgi:hypothetical protein
MRYNDIFVIIFFLSILLALFILPLALILKSYLNIMLTCDVSNNDINIKLNIKYLFNLINIKVPIYSNNKNKKIKNKKNKKEPINKGINKKAIKIEDLKIIYKLVKKIKIKEIYSDINFGNENINFTCFIYVFINCIYGNLINIINPEKIYLNANPNFTKNYINASIKLHVKLTIKDITSIAIAIFKIYKKTKMKKKDGDDSEINRVNTKSYGDNI